jgi:hypothetical protein
MAISTKIHNGILLTLLCLFIACTNNEGLLSQEDFLELNKLKMRYAQASSEETKLAQLLLIDAEQHAAKLKWGAAAKLYGESILYKPSTKALLGYAEAHIYMKHHTDAISAKCRDLKYASKLYEIAIKFAKEEKPLSVNNLINLEKSLRDYPKTSELRPMCPHPAVQQ